MAQIGEREHALAPKYFSFYADAPMPGRNGWYGFSSGLYEPPLGIAAETPVPVKDGVDCEALLADLYATEPASIRPVREVLGRFMEYDGPLDVVVDIGANFGAVAIAAALRGARRVIAVEADPHNAFVLRDHISRYGLDGKIDVIEAAVVKEGGAPVMWRAKGTSGQRSCVFGTVAEDVGSVESISFADVMEQAGHADYCKIDVEGAEYLFLDGDAALADLARIGFLDLELHGHTHELFLSGPLNDATERKTWDLLTKVGVPPRSWVARGEPKIPVAA